jgi:hypothetical protein
VIRTLDAKVHGLIREGADVYVERSKFYPQKLKRVD